MIHFDKLNEPIQQMNEKLQEAAQIARQKPGLLLAGQMINQLRVAAMGHNFLVLRPTKQYFYNPMVKRQEKILQAIQLVVPEVIEITIIKVGKE